MLGSFLLTAGCSSPSGEKSRKESASPSRQEHWVDIFNGRNLEGWTCKMSGFPPGTDTLNTFRAENGILKVSYDDYPVFKGRFAHLFYKQELTDYKLKADYRFVGKFMKDAPSWCYRNSGIMYHSQSPASMGVDQDYPVSLEMQLLGTTDSVRQHTANVCTPGTDIHTGDSLYPGHCLLSSSRYYRDSVWVHVELVVYHDSVICHIVNGDTVLFYTRPQIGGFLLPDDYPLAPGTPLRSGYIALQAEGQPVEFRNIKLLKLK